MEFSVIIPTLNRPDDLKVTLTSVLKQTLAPKEIIIIDQGDNGSTRLLIEGFGDREKVDLIYRKNRTKSLTKARNTGVSLAKHEILTFLDDDVELDEHYLKEIKRVFEKNKAVVVGGKIHKIVQSRSVRKALMDFYRRMFYLSREEDNAYEVQTSFNPTQCYDFKELLHTQWATGCNHSVLKKVAQEVRFDEQLIGYGRAEDVDFTYRVYKKYPSRVYISPEAKLKHFGSVVPTTLPNKSRIYMDAVHKRYLFKKNIERTLKNTLLFYWSRLGGILLFFISLLRKPTWEKLVAVKNLAKAELFTLRNKKYVDSGDLTFFHRWLSVH